LSDLLLIYKPPIEPARLSAAQNMGGHVGFSIARLEKARCKPRNVKARQFDVIFYFETPFRSAPLMRRARQGYLVFAGLACVYVLSRTVKLMEAHRWWLSASVTEGVVVDWYMDDWIRASNGGGPVCSLRSDETPMPESGSVLILRADRCDNGTRSNESDTRLFVAGNSHAVAYKDMLSRLALKEQFRVYLYFRSSCTLFKLTTPFDDESPECKRFLNAVLKDIGANARSGDIVFLPSLRLPRLSDQWGQMSEAEATQTYQSGPHPAGLAGINSKTKEDWLGAAARPATPG